MRTTERWVNVKRLGLLTPSSNTSTEMDYRDWLPDGVFMHVARMYMKDASLAACRALVDEFAPKAAREIATVEPDVVLFSCTGAGALLGETKERALADQLAEISGAHVVSTNQAVSEALGRHASARVAMITPYTPDITAKVAGVQQKAGHDIVCAHGMGIAVNRDIGHVEPQTVLAFAERELAGVEFDVLFVSCTNLRTAPLLEPLAERFGVPVVTSNAASLEAALRLLGQEPDWLARPHTATALTTK